LKSGAGEGLNPHLQIKAGYY